MFLKQMSKIVYTKRNVCETLCYQIIDDYVDQRATANRYQWLGHIFGQGPKSSSQSSRHDNHLVLLIQKLLKRRKIRQVPKYASLINDGKVEDLFVSETAKEYAF